MKYKVNFVKKINKIYPAVEIRLSFNFENIPLNVRLPIRKCFSMSAIINATHTTIRIILINPAITDCHEPKFNTEIARNNSSNSQPEMSFLTNFCNTKTSDFSSVEMDKKNAGIIAKGKMYMKFFKIYLPDCAVYFIKRPLINEKYYNIKNLVCKVLS